MYADDALPFNYSLLPHVWCNERVSSEHGTSLGVGQVGSGLSVDRQDEITNSQTSITADGPSVDYAADQHPQTVFHGAYCHPFKIDQGKFYVLTLNFDP